MKEARGELNMTLITIIAIGAIAGVFVLFKDPIINLIEDKWTDWTKTPVDLNGDGQ